MANFRFDVNTDSAIRLTAKLERLNKSAFPAAVRSTLNDASFEMKKTNILFSAKRNMKVKNPMFFKRYTGVDRAKFSSNIEAMYSTVGFVDRSSRKAQKAVNTGMEANEVGNVDSTGMMYKTATRSGRGLVRRKDYYNKSKLTTNKGKAKNSYVASAFASLKDKKPIMVNTKKGRAMIMVKAIKKMKRGSSKGKLQIKSKLLMLDRTVNKAKAKPTHFNREAALKTQKQMEGFYLKNAEFRFQKVWK